MKRIHHREKEQFKKLFKQEHVDNFEDRYKILEIFLQNESHLTVGELTQLLNKNGYQFTPDFVRDTLKLMCRFGFARKNRFDNGDIRYEHRHLGQHHDHMICTKCKNIYEFKDEQLESLQAQIAASFDFHMLQHKMEIYGICSKCFKEHGRLMPLVNAKQGERVEIKEFLGGSTAHMRLLSMGLRIEDKIDVVTNRSKGQMVVAIGYKRYVLGRGLAKKIWVEPQRSRGVEFMFLSEMKEKQRARVVHIGGNGALRRRILEMGIIKGTEIYVEKYAPLKDPVELIVKGYHVSLRVEEAAQITVNNVK